MKVVNVAFYSSSGCMLSCDTDLCNGGRSLISEIEGYFSRFTLCMFASQIFLTIKHGVELTATPSMYLTRLGLCSTIAI